MTTKTEIKLLPCPFCGGDAEMDTRQGYRALGTGRMGNRIAVYCRSCDADMGVCIEDVPDITPEQVAEMWNRRAAVEADRQDRMPSDIIATAVSCGARRVPTYSDRGDALLFYPNQLAALLSGCGGSQPVTNEARLDLVSRLRALARYQHNDVSVADEAADALISGQPAASEEPCFCDRMYPDSNPDATCGDCPRDYRSAAPVAQESMRVLAYRIKRTGDLPGSDWIDGAPASGATGTEIWSDGYIELAYAAPVAAPVAQEPVAWFTGNNLTGKSATTWDAAVAERWRTKGWSVNPLYAGPVAVQKPPVRTADDQPFASDYTISACYFPRTGAAELSWERTSDGEKCSLTVPVTPEQGKRLASVVYPCVYYSAAQAQHPDDAAVDAFAAAMKDKLAQARAKGRHGWHECAPADLSAMLRAHVEKGDPIDVANFCMFLWGLGQPISAAPVAQEPLMPWRGHWGAIDAKALSTAQEIALMWGADRSQFVSRIQVAVIEAMLWMRDGIAAPVAALSQQEKSND